MARKEHHDFFERWVALTRRLRGLASEAYATVEVGSAQAKLLRHIGRHGGMSQADLARATDTATTLTGRALDPLVARGWVRRKRSEEDRRQYVVELTAAGQRTREKIEEARDGVIARVGAALDARDMADFDRIVGKVLAALDDATDEGSGK